MDTVAPPRQLKIGVIIDKTLGVLERAAVPAAIYVAGLTLVTAGIKILTAGMTGFAELAGSGLVQFVVGVAAAYFLLDAMLRKTGLRARGGEDVFFAYIGMSVLYTLGVMAGLIAIVIPGLVVMARWSIAQPLLVARGEGIMKSLGYSWERTKGNEFQIIAAVLALYVVPIAVIIFLGVTFDPADPLGITVTQAISGAMSALGLAMGVALYGLMEGHRAAGTFE